MSFNTISPRFHAIARMALSILIAMLAGAICWWFNPRLEGTLVDMGWAFNAAHDLLKGLDPYRHPASTNLVPYPLTAAVVVFPWALLPGNSGVVALFGLASGALAYGLLRDHQYWRLIAFASPCFLMAAKSMQWSPLFMLVLFYPALAFVLTAKPTLALPIALSIRWTPLRIASVIGVGLISLVLMPDWPWRWLAQTRDYDGFIPLISVFGPLFLLSLAFWKNKQARFFFLMTITPQHRLFYDQLLLWMIPQSAQQMLLLTFTSWVAFFYIRLTFITLWVSTSYLLFLVYLPAFLIVLWQQPWIKNKIQEMQQRLTFKRDDAAV